MLAIRSANGISGTELLDDKPTVAGLMAVTVSWITVLSQYAKDFSSFRLTTEMGKQMPK